MMRRDWKATALKIREQSVICELSECFFGWGMSLDVLGLHTLEPFTHAVDKIFHNRVQVRGDLSLGPRRDLRCWLPAGFSSVVPSKTMA